MVSYRQGGLVASARGKKIDGNLNKERERGRGKEGCANANGIYSGEENGTFLRDGRGRFTKGNILTWRRVDVGCNKRMG
jgi:hypothetical protein